MRYPEASGLECVLQSADFIKAIFEFVILIFSLCVHESAHAWAASRLGDQTARLQGRVTLNPMYHLDPIGSLLVPALIIFGPLLGFRLFGGAIIGWARPTEIITRNFRRIRRDDNLATLAGPVSNLLLVLLAFVAIVICAHVLPDGRSVVLGSFQTAFSPGASVESHPLVLLCALAIYINLSLFFFNLFPIPPLDGSRLVRNALPYNAMKAYDNVSGWLSFLLMFFLGGYVLRFFLGPSLNLVFYLLYVLVRG
jgi:Zn-dependent protease